MINYGLKLWSNNINYFKKASQLFHSKLFDYIELYIVPNSYKNNISQLEKLNIPFIIHAPHDKHGLNFAVKEKQKNNCILLAEAIEFANKLKAKYIIVHPGINGDIREVTRQLRLIKDKRLVIENLPYYGLNKKGICHAATEEEIKYLLSETETGFCLDVGHAIHSANAQKIDPWKYLKKLLEFSPKLFHLSDGDYSGKYDQHEHFGNGTFPIKDIFAVLPTNALVTIETKKNSKLNLNDFVRDIRFLKELYYGDDILLRLVCRKDSHDLWQWRNNPKIFRWCLNKKKIKLEDHKKWFEKKIKDRNVTIYIVENEKKEKIGQVRLEKTKKRQAYININLNPHFLKKGFGSKIIGKATEFFVKNNPEIKEVLAEILDNNILSKKAFQKAGYIFSHKITKNKQLLTVFKFKKNGTNYR